MATHTHVLVTGGAGFIGSHLVDGLLADPGTRVTVLDTLTYAGSRANLAAHEGDERFRFVQGDVLDATAVVPLVADADRVVHAAAETPRRPFDQRSGRVRDDERGGDPGRARCVSRPRPPAAAGLDRRGVRPERARRAFRRGRPDPPAQPVRRQQGRRRAARARVRDHVRAAGVDRPRDERVRSAPEPREGDPGLHDRRPGRAPDPRLRDGAAVPRVALRDGLGGRVHRGAPARRTRRCVQHRRRPRAARTWSSRGRSASWSGSTSRS